MEPHNDFSWSASLLIIYLCVTFVQGPSLVLADDTNNESTAEFVSPWFSKSKESYGKCLRFKYKFIGPGASSLTIFQKMDYGSKRQTIWTEQAIGISSKSWHYGQTSISAISNFRVRNT